jgi:hypothetical protein
LLYNNTIIIEGGINNMVEVSKSLVTERFKGDEFNNASVLNEGVKLEDLQRECEKTSQKNSIKIVNGGRSRNKHRY